MKKRILFSVIFTLIMLLTLCLAVSAKELEWDILDNGKTLTCSDGRVYTYFPLNPNDEFKAENIIVYENMVTLNGTKYYVKRSEDNLGVASISTVYSGGTEYFYISDELREGFEKFASKEYSYYKLADKYGYNAVDVENGYPGFQIQSKEINVQELQIAKMSTIYGLDSTKSVAHVIGAIYELYGEYYYVDYDSLDNSYFSSYGTFSYREGTVTVEVLGFVDECKYLEFKEDMTSWEPNIIDENQRNIDNAEMGLPVAIAIFVIYASYFGFMIPLVPIIIGLIRILSKKSQHPKRWISMMIPCGVWIICSIVLIVMLF